MNKTKPKFISIISTLIVLSATMTGCSNTQAKCDELLNALTYGMWSESDSAWYYENCKE